jgi:hypothetical protein
VGAAIGKYDAARISTPPLTHYGTLNYPGFRRRKFRFALFKSGKMQSMKYRWLNLLPFGRIWMLQAAIPKLRLAARAENGPCRTNHHFWTSGARYWFATSDKRRRRVWWLIPHVFFLIPNLSSKNIWWQIFVYLSPITYFLNVTSCERLVSLSA